MRPAISDEIGPAICRALGIDPGNVNSLAIFFAAGEPVRVNVFTYAQPVDLEKLEKVLSEYTLTPKVAP